MHICCLFVVCNRMERFTFEELGYVPVGLSYLSGALKQAGHSTEGLCNKFNEPIDGLLNNLEKKPDIFAVSVPSMYSFPKAQELLEEIRNRFKDTKIIVGGFYPTLCPDELILNKNIDAVCIGEGEKAIVEYVRQVQNKKYEKTDNLWIKDNDGTLLKCDKSVFVEDINNIAMDRQIWDKWFYNDKMRKYFIVIQRGCPHRCLYCANRAFAEKSHGKYLRYRNIDSIIEEIKTIKDKYPKMDTVEFNADNIFADMDYFFKLFEALKKFNANQNKKYSFEITGNCTDKFLSEYENITEYLKEANVTKVAFSLESGSEEIRKKLNRPYYTNENIIRFCQKLRKEKIETIISLMYCYPFETDKTCRETIQCIKKAQPNRVQITFLRGLPNTQLNEYMAKNKVPPITLKDAYRHIKTAIVLKIKPRQILGFINDIKNEFLIYRLSQKNAKCKNLAKFYFDKADFKNAIKVLNRLLKIDTSGWIYGDLAIAKMNIGDYEGALKDFNVVLSYEKNEVYIQKREECLLKLTGRKAS